MPVCCIEIQGEEEMLGWNCSYLLYGYSTSRGISYSVLFKHTCYDIKDKAPYLQ